jgi:mannose-1-phosphate guanylyltransferase/mannose-6-phosphate isomerase
MDSDQTTHKPWGSFSLLETGDGFKVKRLDVLPGARLSNQYHQHRSEHWFVVAGTASVWLDEKEITLQPGDNLDIPQLSRHRLSNPSQDVKLVLIEVQHGPRCEEDDIVRLSDDYGRCSTLPAQ